MKNKYTPGFLNLISDETKISSLIEGSFVTGASYKRWEEMRFFITKAFNQNGKILDVGCANGFLLFCFQEWSSFSLDPYGFDESDKHIGMARELFPEKNKHFYVSEISNFLKNKPGSFPDKFNLIFWNVWDNWFFDNKENIVPLKNLIDSLDNGGRLILGFYDNENRDDEIKTKQLEDSGFKVSKILKNKYGPQSIAFIEQE